MDTKIKYSLTRFSAEKFWFCLLQTLHYWLHYFIFLCCFSCFSFLCIGIFADIEMLWRNKSFTWSWFSELCLGILQFKNKSVQLKLWLHLIILICILNKKYFERWGINVLQPSKKTNQFVSFLKLAVVLLSHRSLWTETQTYQCVQVLLFISE